MTEYQAAYQDYIRHGNLARVAREQAINENSLRDYARRHDWAGDREKTQKQKQQLLDEISTGVARAVTGFLSSPTEENLRLARGAAQLDVLLGGGHGVSESFIRTYDGSREEIKNLVMSAMVGAQRAHRHAAVASMLGLLARLEGHDAPSLVASDEEDAPTPRYQESHPSASLRMVPPEWLNLKAVPVPFHPLSGNPDSDANPRPIASEDYLRYIIRTCPKQWFRMDQIPEAFRP